MPLVQRLIRRLVFSDFGPGTISTKGELKMGGDILKGDEPKKKPKKGGKKKAAPKKAAKKKAAKKK